MFRFWRNPFRLASSRGAQPPDDGQNCGMFVRLANGKRVEIPGAEYVMTVEGGRVSFLNKNRKVLREFRWGEVVAHGRKR